MTITQAKHDAAEIVRRFESSTITLHEAHREWLTREISAALEREGAITPGRRRPAVGGEPGASAGKSE